MFDDYLKYKQIQEEQHQAEQRLGEARQDFLANQFNEQFAHVLNNNEFVEETRRKRLEREEELLVAQAEFEYERMGGFDYDCYEQ